MITALIGIRCSGKTATGRILAEKLGCEFVDTDLSIASRERRSIYDIIERDGEEAFRKLETAALKRALASDGRVIACGGGIVLNSDNTALLRKHATVIWLSATAQTCAGRMASDEGKGIMRPSLTGVPPVEEISDLFARRNPLYKKACHHRVDTDGESPGRVAKKIRQFLIRQQKGSDPFCCL